MSIAQSEIQSLSAVMLRLNGGLNRQRHMKIGRICWRFQPEIASISGNPPAKIMLITVNDVCLIERKGYDARE
ncbi:hypothetical protein CRM79_01235 [Pantoea agglomerans]|nr:hypothetical protein CRM79_01235 [Pantoea agglomerans]